MTGHGKERRRSRDEVLDAIDSLLTALRDSARRNRDAARRAQMIRRLRSHGRSYAEILGRNPTSSAHRITRQRAETAVSASERLERAEVQALHGEGLELDKIAHLCGMSRADVEVLIRESTA